MPRRQEALQVDKLWELGSQFVIPALMLGAFLKHLETQERRHDQRVAAFIGAIETLVSKYGSVVRMVTTKEKKDD
jgi:hypothetical protein